MGDAFIMRVEPSLSVISVLINDIPSASWYLLLCEGCIMKMIIYDEGAVIYQICWCLDQISGLHDPRAISVQN